MATWKLGRGAALTPSPIVVGDELSVVTGGRYSVTGFRRRLVVLEN